MQTLYVCFILAGLILETSALPPDWSGQQSTFTFDATDSVSKCSQVTFLSASSRTGKTVIYTLKSQDPDGGFDVTFNNDASQYQLTCTAASITAPSYTVVVTASYDAVIPLPADLEITITVTGLVADECDLSDQNCNCPDSPGNFACTCNSGYSGDGSTCQDKNECTLDEDNCHENAACANTDGSFTCTCNAGYSGAGETCTDKNECTLDEDNCHENAACANTDGSFTCTCNAGYSGAGETCTDKNECELGESNCDDNAECDNTPGGFTCTCDSGYFGDGTSCQAEPEWTTEESHTLIKNDNDACDPVTILNAATVDNSTVTYSIVSQTPDEAGFTVSGDSVYSLTCDLANITVTTYTVVVRAENTANGQTKDLTMTIAVKVPPVFVEPDPDASVEAHKIYICETLQAGDEIMTLMADDEDGDTERIFSLAESSPDETKALFEVVGDKLKVKSGVDQDAFDIDKANATMEYTIILEVSDGLLSSTLPTTIYVEDDNDNIPVFSGSYNATILETVPAGTSVLQITVVDNDKTAEYNNVTLTLIEIAQFDLDGDVIRVAPTANFDVTTTPTYSLTVTASDDAAEDPQTNSQIITITIESEPQFGNLNINRTVIVYENATEVDTIYELAVTDRDNSPFNVTVVRSEDKFTVAGNDLKLKPGESLDAENETLYEVQLKASDGTYDVYSEFLTVIVLDVNDNTPVFTELNPEVDISEATSIGTTVYTVTARDADIGNPNLTYSLTEIGGSRFQIDEKDGEITTITTLSFKESNQFKVQVNVNDGEKSASTVLTVNLKTGPYFLKPTNGSSYTSAENTAIGEIVLVITSYDPDNDEPKYELLSQDPDTTPMKFGLEGDKHDKLVTKDTFDVDADDAVKSYILELKVSDGRDYTDNETIKFNIAIGDSNDSPPMFSQDSYKHNVTETAEIGSTVYTVTAEDSDDTEPNNKISYTLSGTSDFRIDQDTGDIIVVHSLEYDKQASYAFSVTATDNGSPPRSATTDVTFSILAEPEFKNLPAEIFKDENLPEGTTVFFIAVADADGTWDGVVSILSQSPGDMFKVEGTDVKTKNANLDAESEQSYSLKFKITDGHFVVKSDTLKININDLNDNAPVIEAVDPVEINENKAIGSQVVDIEATDEDATAANNVMTYSIISGNDENVFEIDTASGAVTLENPPLLEQYVLKINVSDSGTPVKTATIDVTINVNHNPVDECSSNPCKNGAACTPTVNAYSCQCVPGWNGTNCETNIDDCSPDPCENGGTCTDGINSYTCNCTEGWTGQTCTVACTGNTYGRNCEESCICNATKLVTIADKQQCHIQTGACKCNITWTGTACETDVDECNEANICNEKPNQVCENTIGDFYCTCEQGYVESSEICVNDTRDTTIIVKRGEKKVIVKMSIDAPCNSKELKLPSVYESIKADLEDMLHRALPSSKRLVVTSISCGSLDFKTEVTINETDATKLANEISISKSNVVYNNNTVSVNNIEVNSSPLNTSTAAQTSTEVCKAYTAIQACTKHKRCVYENGFASCELIKSDNTALILGLGLGVCLPLVLMAIIAVLYFYYYRMKKLRYDKRHPKQGWRKENSPWHGKLKSNGMKFDTRNYNRNQYYDNAYFNGSFSENRRHLDVPAVGYTTI